MHWTVPWSGILNSYGTIHPSELGVLFFFLSHFRYVMTVWRARLSSPRRTSHCARNTPTLSTSDTWSSSCVTNVLSRKVKMSMFNNWLKSFIYNFSKMEERCGTLQKGLYTNFSACLSFMILLYKKNGIRNCTQARQLECLYLYASHITIFRDFMTTFISASLWEVKYL